MSYLLPKELSYQLKISEKTVYNYINKHRDKIRVKKEFWKTFVHSEDFTNVLQKIYSMRSNMFQQATEPDDEKTIWSDSESFQQIKSDDFEYLQSKNESLEKQNNNLTEQLNKYAILLREEKNEKLDLVSKYDDLNKQHVNKVEEFGKAHITQQQKYGRLLASTRVSITIAILMVVLYLISSDIV